MPSTDRIEVIAYLKKELRDAKGKEAKDFIKNTIEYLKSKETKDASEWEQFKTEAEALLLECNKEIEVFGLQTVMKSSSTENESFEFIIQALDKTIRYQNTFCHISRAESGVLYFSGLSFCGNISGIKTLKKKVAAELKSKELLERCQKIKEVVL